MIPTIDKPTVYNQAAALARELDRNLLKIQQYKAWLDTIADATLLASPFNCVQADLDVLRSAFADLNQLATLYQGGATLSPAKDFRTFAKLTYAFGSAN